MSFKQLARDRLDVADIIYDKEKIRVCRVCCDESDLRELTCGHLLCSGCLGKKIAESKKKGTDFSCLTCLKVYPGCSAASFPVAKQALASNQAVYDRREREGAGPGTKHSRDECEKTVNQYESETEAALSKQKSLIDSIKNPEEKAKAKDHWDQLWDYIKPILQKLEKMAKEAVVDWAFGRLKVVGGWLKDYFFPEVKSNLN